MLLLFPFIWDEHLCRSNIPKQCIELLQPDTAAVHLEPYQIVPKTWEFEKAKINKVLAENIFDS